MADEAAEMSALLEHRRRVEGATRDALLVESYAHTAAVPTSPPKPEGNARFGTANAVNALRALADMIEARGCYVQDVAELTRAYCDDFAMTALTVVYAKRIKE